MCIQCPNGATRCGCLRGCRSRRPRASPPKCPFPRSIPPSSIPRLDDKRIDFGGSGNNPPACDNDTCRQRAHSVYKPPEFSSVRIRLRSQRSTHPSEYSMARPHLRRSSSVYRNHLIEKSRDVMMLSDDVTSCFFKWSDAFDFQIHPARSKFRWSHFIPQASRVSRGCHTCRAKSSNADVPIFGKRGNGSGVG